MAASGAVRLEHAGRAARLAAFVVRRAVGVGAVGLVWQRHVLGEVPPQIVETRVEDGSRRVGATEVEQSVVVERQLAHPLPHTGSAIHTAVHGIGLESSLHLLFVVLVDVIADDVANPERL